MSEDEVVSISYSGGFVRKKPLSELMFKGYVEDTQYPFPSPYEIRHLSENATALVHKNLEMIAYRGEWLRIRDAIDTFYQTYSKEEIDAYNEQNARNLIEILQR